MLWACHWRQRRSGFAADHALGNSVGANEWVACSDCALRAFAVGDWDCFGDPLLGTTLLLWGLSPGALALVVNDCYLVDSASSHMLVSKIKPCMSKYKQLYRETANGSLNQLSFI